MRSKIQNELTILKLLNKNELIDLLIHTLEDFLYIKDDEELILTVKQFQRDYFIMYKGLELLTQSNKLNLKDIKIEQIYYLYSQLNFL